MFLLLTLFACGTRTACADMNDAYAACGLAVQVNCAQVPDPDDATFSCVANALWASCDTQRAAQCGSAGSTTSYDTGTSYYYGY